MLANAQKGYVFKTVAPSVVPEEHSEPKRVLVCVIAKLLGGILGVFIVFVRAYIPNGEPCHKELTIANQDNTSRSE